MAKMSNLVVTGIIALVCGFLGALGAVTVFEGQLAGPQGATGLSGPPGEQGPAGVDGRDGVDGQRGPRGPRGRDGDAAQDVPVDLGTEGCVGRSVEVVTDVTVNRQQEMQLEKQPLCVAE